MNILFIGKRQRLTRHGLLPIYIRVTIQGQRFEVSTNHHVKPAE
ncbi:MAG: Arm DNA-binding domain-containing protein [Chitinophagaceae bacterium]